MTLPLAGVRVLDLGIITAGAGASAILADLGADVVKIESATYRDPFRRWPTSEAIKDRRGDSPFFRSTNRNKRSMCLDLKAEGGREVFLKLVASADVVVENFRRGALDALGLSFAEIAAANPRIILASISSQGETGPDAGHVSFGSTLEAMGGLAWLTGYPDDNPVISGRDLNYPDQVATIFAAGMIATALLARNADSGSVHLDMSQRELTTFLCGDAFASPEVAERTGNADRLHWLQDCFASRDGWVAVTADDRDKPTLATLLNKAIDPANALSDWVAGRSSAECVATLRAAGIAAAAVATGHDLLSENRPIGCDALAQDSTGAIVKGFPFQIRETPLKIYRDAAPLGADTIDVLREIGGYTAREIDDLVEAKVVSPDRVAASA